MKFKPGDVVRHKATSKKSVVKRINEEGKIIVTTEDDEVKVYNSEELEIFEK